MSIMDCFKSNKKHISKTDRFLYYFDQKNPQKSESQQKEIEVYKDLFHRRDTKIKTE